MVGVTLCDASCEESVCPCEELCDVPPFGYTPLPKWVVAIPSWVESVPKWVDSLSMWVDLSPDIPKWVESSVAIPFWVDPLRFLGTFGAKAGSMGSAFRSFFTTSLLMQYS